jgi:hypothetical protein
LMASMVLNSPRAMEMKTLNKVRMMKAPMLMVLDLWNGAGDRGPSVAPNLADSGGAMEGSRD